MKKIKIVFGFTAFLGSCFAQESINTNGGEAIGVGGSASYTIGEVIYTTIGGSTGTIAQGVQHPYEIYILGVDKHNLDISLLVYPNPTANNLTLQIIEYTNEPLTFVVFDIQGKLLQEGKINSEETEIEMAHYERATYFMEIRDKKSQPIQSFKIIKQ